MKSETSALPQVAFWGICLIIMAWLAATILFEMHLGWPMNGIQWGKRIIGWGVEIFLARALVLAVRRYYRTR